MAHADHFGERMATNRAAAGLLHQYMEDFDLERELHDLQWVRVSGQPRTESIVCKSGIPSSGSSVYVAVARRNVPIRMIEGASMSQDLKSGHLFRCCQIGGETKPHVDGIRAGDDIRATHCCRTQFAVGLRELDIEFGDGCIGVWRSHEDFGVCCGGGDAHNALDAFRLLSCGVGLHGRRESCHVTGVCGQLECRSDECEKEWSGQSSTEGPHFDGGCWMSFDGGRQVNCMQEGRVRGCQMLSGRWCSGGRSSRRRLCSL